MTPLNGCRRSPTFIRVCMGFSVMVESADHKSSCIAISGLASHPFGSWQPKDDKDFMWIRDELPEDMPGTKMFLYGYDTRLNHSASFQKMPELARELIDNLDTSGWGLPTGKPGALPRS